MPQFDLKHRGRFPLADRGVGRRGCSFLFLDFLTLPDLSDAHGMRSKTTEQCSVEGVA